jgi:hypothetical protein
MCYCFRPMASPVSALGKGRGGRPLEVLASDPLRRDGCSVLLTDNFLYRVQQFITGNHHRHAPLGVAHRRIATPL